tara:strand:+ start:10337 stop:10795 length:459 start_codon:yes stop_codon:yes gene_type:complete
VELDNSKAIRIKILDFLARREHTSKELFSKLERRVESTDLLSDEIKKLKNEGLINHERYTEQYVHSRSKKGYGPLRIEQELKQRGIDETISQPIMQNIDWNKLSLDVLKKKLNTDTLLDVNQELKMKNFLNYRGFNFEQIKQAFLTYKEYQK